PPRLLLILLPARSILLPTRRSSDLVRGGVECGSTLHAVFDLLLGGRGPAVPARGLGPALGVVAPGDAAPAAPGRGDGHAVDLSRAARPASVRASFRPLSGTAAPRVSHPARRAAW